MTRNDDAAGSASWLQKCAKDADPAAARRGGDHISHKETALSRVSAHHISRIKRFKNHISQLSEIRKYFDAIAA
jgi:hypothetical protein